MVLFQRVVQFRVSCEIPAHEPGFVFLELRSIPVYLLPCCYRFEIVIEPMREFALHALDFTKSRVLLKMVSLIYLEYTNQRLNLLSRKYDIERFVGFEKNIEIAFLGSGASINEISDLRWSDIAKKTTIGPNGWMFNEKGANYYTLEGKRGLMQEPYFSEFRDVLHHEPLKFNRAIILIHTSAVKSIKSLRAASTSDVKFLLYGHVKPPTLSKGRLAEVLREMIALCSLERYQGIAIGKGSTLERVISLSITSDAKELVLAGVDLHNKSTFYDKNEGLVARLGIEIEDLKKSVHKTNDPSKKRFTITDMLLAFKIASGKPSAFIKIESSKSALASLLHKWN